jgi:hypothetical protein
VCVCVCVNVKQISAPCCSTLAPAGKHTPYMRPTTCSQTHRGKCVTQAQTHRPNHVCVSVCVCECEANQRALLQHSGSSREAHTVHAAHHLHTYTQRNVCFTSRDTQARLCVCVNVKQISAPCCSTMAPAGKHTPYTQRKVCYTSRGTQARSCVCVCECEANQRTLLQHIGFSREAHTVHAAHHLLTNTQRKVCYTSTDTQARSYVCVSVCV